MGFSRQEYLSGLPCPPRGDLPNPGIEPTSLMSPALVSEFFTTSVTWDAQRDNMRLEGHGTTEKIEEDANDLSCHRDSK